MARKGWPSSSKNQATNPYWVDYAFHFGQGVDVVRWHGYHGIPYSRGVGNETMTFERACFATLRALPVRWMTVERVPLVLATPDSTDRFVHPPNVTIEIKIEHGWPAPVLARMPKYQATGSSRRYAGQIPRNQ